MDLTLAAEPTVVQPGETLTYTVGISAPTMTLHDLVLSLSLPAGLVYVEGSGQGFQYLSAERRLVWALPELAMGQRLEGRFQARVVDDVPDQGITTTVEAFGGELEQPVTATVAIEVASSASAQEDATGVAALPSEEAWIGPAGGALVGRAGRVLVLFPAGAVAQPVLVRFAAAPAVLALPSELFDAFQLTATDKAGRPVTQFARPLTLILNLAGYEAMLRSRQGSPSLYWLDEARGRWQRLSSQVDWTRGTATATVEHLSTFGAGTTSTLSYGAQHLPTVHGFVSDLWSGNSSVSYPLVLPPGPAGFGLKLSLDYSSEGVNSIRAGASISGISTDESRAKTFNRQASFVGWGWSLGGLGQITVKLPEAQRYYLSFGGGSFELKYTATHGWQTEPQSFLRIEHSQDGLNSDPWYIWTPDGTRYTFGSGGGWGHGEHWVRNTGSCGQHALAMHLTEVQDTHGNKAVVTYATETKHIRCADGSSQPYVRAIRPTRLEYFAAGEALATVRVEFTYVTRNDTGVPGKNDPYVEAFWSDYRLSTVTVQVRNNTAADAFATVRSYSLTHDYLWKDQASGQGLLRLTSITERGKDGGALPAWSFTYTMPKGNQWLNHTLLATADNGQGGRITFGYGEVSNIFIGNCGGLTMRYRVSQMEIADGLGNQAHNRTRFVFNHQKPFAWASSNDYPLCAKDFEFGGYGFVRQEVQDGAGVLYQVTDNYYHQCGTNSPPQDCNTSNNQTMDPRKGKRYLSVISSQRNSGELARTATTWSTTTVKGAQWVYKADETRSLGSAAQKTVYEYQTANQGGAQYGNVTHVREYSDGGTTLYRVRETQYFPRNDAGGAYIVNRPARQVLWDAAGACRGETRYIYDNASSYSTPPAKGDVTRKQMAQTSCGGSWSETRYAYDSYGNRIEITDPRGNTTTTVYDTSGNWPKLFAYPTSTTAP